MITTVSAKVASISLPLITTSLNPDWESSLKIGEIIAKDAFWSPAIDPKSDSEIG
jgi:hypothetical protein